MVSWVCSNIPPKNTIGTLWQKELFSVTWYGSIWYPSVNVQMDSISGSQKAWPINLKKLWLWFSIKITQEGSQIFLILPIFLKRPMLLFLTTKSASEFLSKNNVSNVFLLGFSFSFSFFLCNGDRRLDVENISPIVFQKHPSLFFSCGFGRTWKCLSHHSHLKNTWDSVVKFLSWRLN